MNAQIASTPTTILDGAGHIAVDLRCTHCGCNLRTQPASGKCPECGHPVVDTAGAYLPQLDAEGRITVDLPCVSCGYNLRTQPITGRCPECAAPVAHSARGHYLHFAPPRWVARLAGGALMLIVAIGGSFVGGILFVVVGFLAGAGIGRGASGLDYVFLILAITVSVPCLWLFIRGLIDLTAADPFAKFRREGLSARRLVRYCLIALPVLILTSIALASLGFWASPLGISFLLSAALILLSALAGLAYFVLPLAVLRHIMALMRRTPRTGLVLFAKIEFWALLISSLVYVGNHVVFMFVAFPAFAAIAGGPNMPVMGYAGGPNSPNTITTTSAPALTALGYAPTATQTISYTGPDGVTIATTVPASPPLAAAPLPTFGPLLLISGVAMWLGGCGSLGVGIAGLILLIMVWRALANAAHLAEASALSD